MVKHLFNRKDSWEIFRIRILGKAGKILLLVLVELRIAKTFSEFNCSSSFVHRLYVVKCIGDNVMHYINRKSVLHW